VFTLYDLTAKAVVPLPPGREFDNRSLFSVPYVPPDVADRTRPVARRFRISRRRLGPGRRRAVFRFRLSETADARIRLRRRGKTLRTITRRGRRAGANAVRFNGRVRGRFLRPGRYVAVLRATDAAGNASVPRVVRFRVVKRRSARGQRRGSGAPARVLAVV
jgi:hypothetical protein